MTRLFDPAVYTFSWFAVPTLLVAFIILAIGLFVLKQNSSSRIHFTFFLLCAALFIWLTGYSWIYLLNDSAIALQVYRSYTFLGVVLIALNVYHFTILWLRLWEAQKWFVFLGYVLCLGIYMLAWSTDWVIPYMDRYYWGFYSHYRALGALIFGTFIFYFVFSFVNYTYRLKHPIPTVQRSQIQAVIFAFCFAFTGATDFLPKLWHLEIYPFGYLSAFFWIMGMAYAIVKYRVMDIQTVIHKTLMWIGTSVVYISPGAVVAFLMKDWLFHLPKSLYTGFVFLFMILFVPYVRLVQPYIDQWFQRRQWDLSQVIKQFTEELTHLKTLEDLAHHILQTIQKTVYPQDVNLMLWDEGGSECMIFDVDGKAVKINCGKHDVFFRFLGTYREVVLAEYVEIDPRLESVRNGARSYFGESNAQVCIPIALDEKLIGMINLGRKANLKGYSGTEIRFFSDLRGSAAIAISNSLHLIAMQANLRKWNEELDKQVQERTRELKEAQAQLIQAEKLATIGTLAGGVAHEINNPLAAILTNAQMLLAEKLDEDAKGSVELIEEAAERCRNIVQKLMKYSRKSPEQERTQTADLKEVIENTVSFLRYQLDQENIVVEVSFRLKSRVAGNPNELSQVFTNLILNARDALQRKQSGRRISIRGYEKGSEAFVEIEDNGCGIPKENLSKIFDPFFTTKDVGKGTGLGLSIAQGIVQKYGGSISVKSQTGKGTVFTSQFPFVNGKAPQGASSLSG